MKWIKKIVFAVVAISICGCSNYAEKQETDNPERVVSFKGREIDLTPYIEGFPYTNFNPFYAAGKLYYIEKGEKMLLKEVSLSGDPDLSKGKIISDIDFAKRNVWDIKYNKTDNKLYWMGDEKNDEIINLTRLDPTTGEVEKLTDVPYIFSYRWNEARDQIAYVARLGVNEKRLGELRIYDLSTGKERAVAQDSPEMRFSWGSLSWRPNGKGIVSAALKDADRTYGNLVYIDLKSGEKETLTDVSRERSSPYALKDWLNPNVFLYLSNEDGFHNVYQYDLSTGKTKSITRFSSDVSNAELITIDGRKYIFATTTNPVEDHLYLVDPASGATLLQQRSKEKISIYDVDQNRAIVSASSTSSMFRIDELTISVDTILSETLIDVPESLKAKIYKAQPERINYPTFDNDPATGEKRRIHAFLYKPKNPRQIGESLVMIESFYGGDNKFSIQKQILADAGIYVLSPAPRGSDGFGKNFQSLNDNDLGGSEIVDIFYAAQFISDSLGIPPENIGVYGGSHGGYATMRILTFPGEINGVKASFDWGFGISHAGFSDIIHFYEHCNIPDWVALEAGDPKTEADKLKDRSPLYHADKMKGSLLLTHGTNDSRVPISGSRMMADSLQKYNKQVTLVEFEDQGHGIKGLENNVTFYTAWFEFLERTTSEQTAASE